MIQNTPHVWLKDFPFKTGARHKYDYGHALIYGAPQLTGATRLAAEAAARVGAGLVTVIAPAAVANVYRAALPAHIMVREDQDWWDDRVTAVLYGPGGLPQPVKLRRDVCMVLDAAAPEGLVGDLKAYNAILTPHEGEFLRLLPEISGAREVRAQVAARQSGAVIVLKGAQTVIAGPQGDVFINENDSPYLATAGTGDVLAGLITGLAAMGMPPLKAVCAGTWIHGEAGKRGGPGLVAADLPGLVPGILSDFT